MAITTNTTTILGGYSDPQGVYGSPIGQSTGTVTPHNTGTILRNIQGDISEMRNEMIRLRGFYEWMIHAYPETIAQYKALMDLQRASNELTSPAAEQAYEQSRARSAI